MHHESVFKYILSNRNFSQATLAILPYNLHWAKTISPRGRIIKYKCVYSRLFGHQAPLYSGALCWDNPSRGNQHSLLTDRRACLPWFLVSWWWRLMQNWERHTLKRNKIPVQYKEQFSYVISLSLTTNILLAFKSIIAFTFGSEMKLHWRVTPAGNSTGTSDRVPAPTHA